MNCLKTGAVILLAAGTASCASGPFSLNSNDLITTDQYYGAHPVELVTVGDYYAHYRSLPPDPNRKISEEDCSALFTFDGANLRCR